MSKNSKSHYRQWVDHNACCPKCGTPMLSDCCCLPCDTVAFNDKQFLCELFNEPDFVINSLMSYTFTPKFPASERTKALIRACLSGDQSSIIHCGLPATDIVLQAVYLTEFLKRHALSLKCVMDQSDIDKLRDNNGKWIVVDESDVDACLAEHIQAYLKRRLKELGKKDSLNEEEKAEFELLCREI